MKIDGKSCIRLGVTVFVTFLAIHYWSRLVGFVGLLFGAASALLIGCAIAYVLNILMSFYEKHYFVKNKSRMVEKSKRVVCMLASILTLAAVVALVIGLVVPELIACVKLLIAEVPTAVDYVVEWMEKSGILENVMLEDAMSSLGSIDWQQKVTGLSTAVSATFSAIAKLVIGFIFAIYLLCGKETLTAQCNHMMEHYLKPSWTEKIRYVLRVFDESFHSFIVGQCIEAVILGVLCILGMGLLKLPYAMMIGTLIGFTALIPVAGAYIGAAVGVFMILTVSPVQALVFLIFVVILQQIEGNLIYPKVVGSSIGLPGVWVLAAVTIGGDLKGIIGMLLGVPTVAAIYRLIGNDMKKK